MELVSLYWEWVAILAVGCLAPPSIPVFSIYMVRPVIMAAFAVAWGLL